MSVDHHPEKSGRPSVSRTGAGPQLILLPGVKLDLALVVLFLLCLWLGLGIAGLSRGLELLLLLAGSAGASLWLAWRTRRVMLRAQVEGRRDGA